MTMRNEIASPVLVALVANTDTPIEFSGRDDKTVVVINASADCKITVKAGNGIQGVSDMTLDVKKGVNLLKLESGRFKNVSGENKGKIVLNSTSTPSVGVVEMA